MTAGADPQRAALMAAGDPNVPSGVSDVFTAMMKAKQKTGRTGKPLIGSESFYTPDPNDPTKAIAITDQQGNPIVPRYTDPLRAGGLAFSKRQQDLVARMEKEPELKGAIKAAEKDAEYRANMRTELPKAQNALQSAYDETDKIKGFITKAIPKASAWTTGLMSQAIGSIGGTEARNLRGILDSIKASIGLQSLKELKAGGGTLGQVTEAEHKLLQDKWTSLDQAATKEEFVSRLNDLIASLDRFKNRSTYAFENLYKQPFKAIDTSIVPESQSVVAPAGGQTTNLPEVNSKGWELKVDANGNKAYVGPNNELEEVR